MKMKIVRASPAIDGECRPVERMISDPASALLEVGDFMSCWRDGQPG
jgi:hypothetical protein